MKNFARLCRFARPYRVRFVLSIGCAAMVAVLFGGNIGLVYPLLQILFQNQNAQHWVAERVDASKTEVAGIEARLGEIAFLSTDPRPTAAEVRQRHQAYGTSQKERSTRLQELRRKTIDDAIEGANLSDSGVEKHLGKPVPDRELTVLDARLAELNRSFRPFNESGPSALVGRKDELEKELYWSNVWLNGYLWAQPRVERYLPAEGFRTLMFLIGILMVTVALRGFFQFLQEVLVADMAQLSLFDIRNQFFRKTMALDLGAFNEQGTSDTIARFTNDLESVNQGMLTIFGRVVREPLRIVSCLGGALWLNWRLTLLALVLVPVSAATTYRAGKIMKRAVRKSLESMSNIYKILQESLQGVKVVKAFTMERYERRRFFLETKSFYKKSIRVATIDALSDPVLELLSLSTVSIALLSGSFLVLRHTTMLDLGFFKLQLAARPMAMEDLFTLYAMLAGISDPVRKLANVHSKIQRAAAAADRVCALMDREPAVVDNPRTVRLPRHQRTIDFDRVEFGYPGRPPVLQGLSLTVRHGETIALVGSNGCGKSTLMSLLPRFYDVQGGAIRIDGHDIREVRTRSLRAQIGMVTQETILFNDTIANNIAYGNRHISRDAIVAAAKRSYAHQFITALPDGYDTMVGESGNGLSGGQKQRIALARAMLRDPAILILDEATSAVDIQDEALIRKAVEEFARGRTTFLITHSMGTLQFADRIVLMDSGRIDAVGTEAELRKSSPLYRKLYEIHFQRESA